MDLKNVLTDEVPIKEKQDNTTGISIHKKPIQLRDIENRSSSKTRIDIFESKEQMTELLNKEKGEIHKQSWNKLDKGLKINRLKEFIKRETIDKELSKTEVIQLSDLLLSACSNNKLNRVNDVIYDKGEGQIEQLKNLSLSEDRMYHLRMNEPKQGRTSGKPKSNIDRFLRAVK